MRPLPNEPNPTYTFAPVNGRTKLSLSLTKSRLLKTTNNACANKEEGQENSYLCNAKCFLKVIVGEEPPCRPFDIGVEVLGIQTLALAGDL